MYRVFKMKDWIDREGQEYVNLSVEGLERLEDIGGSEGEKKWDFDSDR
jgi:hypothetical protein